MPEKKQRYTAYERLMIVRKLMAKAPTVRANLDAAEREWALICIKGAEFGINLNEKGEVKDMDRFASHAWDVVNFRKLSRILAGGDLNITRDNIPQKYAREVFDVINTVERILKNIFKRRYEKTSRDRRAQEISEKSKRDAKRIKKINRERFAVK